MPLNNYEDLNDMHIDVLREIGNIGSGNAASSLAMLLSDTIDISVPTVRILEYEQVMEELGGPEQMVVAELLCLEGDVQGMIMFLLHENFANQVLKALIGDDAPTAENLDEISGSALQEVANIMAAAYANAISGLTGFTIDITVPSLCVDMLGAVLSTPAIHYANISDKMIFIEDKFSGTDLHAPNHILLIPDVDSLQKIMTSLGIEL